MVNCKVVTSWEIFIRYYSMMKIENDLVGNQFLLLLFIITLFLICFQVRPNIRCVVLQFCLYYY